MTALVPDLKERQRFARSRAGKIRDGITNYLETLAAISTAYEQRDWEALGYDSWQEYIDGEFSAERLRIAFAYREKAIADLRLAGLSTRAIAPVVGVSKNTVARQVSQDGTPEPVQGIDGKSYSPARSPFVEAMTGAIEDAGQRAQDHRVDTPGDPDPDRVQGGPVSDAPAAGSGSPQSGTEEKSGPPCEACGETLDEEHWDLGFMRCETCDPEGRHLADNEDGCRICAVCPTCGNPRWSTT